MLKYLILTPKLSQNSPKLYTHIYIHIHTHTHTYTHIHIYMHFYLIGRFQKKSYDREKKKILKQVRRLLQPKYSHYYTNGEKKNTETWVTKSVDFYNRNLN